MVEVERTSRYHKKRFHFRHRVCYSKLQFLLILYLILFGLVNPMSPLDGAVITRIRIIGIFLGAPYRALRRICPEKNVRASEP